MLKRKKLLAALLAGTMMLSLAGCGKKADTSGDTTDTTDPNTPPCGSPADPPGKKLLRSTTPRKPMRSCIRRPLMRAAP